MMTPRPIYITTSRHPFIVSVLVACLVAGTWMAIAGLRPPSLARGLPETVMTAWLVILAVGGAVGLTGVFWRGAIDDALFIEACGLAGVGAAASLYVIVLFTLNPLGSAVSAGGLLSGVAIGAISRAVQCVIERRRVRGSRQTRQTLRFGADPGIPVLATDDAPDDDHEGDPS